MNHHNANKRKMATMEGGKKQRISKNKRKNRKDKWGRDSYLGKLAGENNVHDPEKRNACRTFAEDREVEENGSERLGRKTRGGKLNTLPDNH